MYGYIILDITSRCGVLFIYFWATPNAYRQINESTSHFLFIYKSSSWGWQTLVAVVCDRIGVAYNLLTNKNIKIMKTRIILLVALFALVSTTTVSAQFLKCKKVAITEVVDRSGNVNDSTKSSIRNILTDAITNSEGYEGYASISFTTLEMDFDRTGNISRATLTYVQKQMMEYILVSEVIPLNKTVAQLSARIIETSTGRIVASSSVETYMSVNYLRPACSSLAYKLVGAI